MIEAELIETVRIRAEFGIRREDGSTIEDHARKAAANGLESACGDVEKLHVSSSARRYLEWFTELKTSAQSNGFGYSIVTFEAMESWARLTARRLTPWVVRVLRTLDAEYNRVSRGKAEESNDD